MSIKPVDFQVMIPRTMEASKVSSDENHKNYSMLQQQAVSTQHSAENSLRQVYSQKSAQEAKITQRQKEKENSRQDKKRKNGDNKNKPGGRTLQTSTIDIKI